MSKVICVAGESGSGKTTSMRNLDPKTTLYIDCDKKGLSWKGWRSQYNSENQNYIKTDFAKVVQQTLQKVDKVEKWKHIKVVVIDTINGLMVSDEMRRSKEKGYDKWVDLAACVWDLVNEAYEYRDDLDVQDNQLIYIVEFTDEFAKYHYKVNAISGEIVSFESEM